MKYLTQGQMAVLVEVAERELRERHCEVNSPILKIAVDKLRHNIKVVQLHRARQRNQPEFEAKILKELR